jgi:ferrous iron transport protein A
MQKIKLSQLKEGQNAKIHSFVEENSEINIKFLEMGFLIETPVQIIHIAPFGDPIAVQILDYSLAIRKNEAEQVWVNYE